MEKFKKIIEYLISIIWIIFCLLLIIALGQNYYEAFTSLYGKVDILSIIFWIIPLLYIPVMFFGSKNIFSPTKKFSTKLITFLVGIVLLLIIWFIVNWIFSTPCCTDITISFLN